MGRREGQNSRISFCAEMFNPAGSPQENNSGLDQQTAGRQPPSPGGGSCDTRSRFPSGDPPGEGIKRDRPETHCRATFPSPMTAREAQLQLPTSRLLTRIGRDPIQQDGSASRERRPEHPRAPGGEESTGARANLGTAKAIIDRAQSEEEAAQGLLAGRRGWASQGKAEPPGRFNQSSPG